MVDDAARRIFAELAVGSQMVDGDVRRRGGLKRPVLSIGGESGSCFSRWKTKIETISKNPPKTMVRSGDLYTANKDINRTPNQPASGIRNFALLYNGGLSVWGWWGAGWEWGELPIFRTHNKET